MTRFDPNLADTARRTLRSRLSAVLALAVLAAGTVLVGIGPSGAQDAGAQDTSAAAGEAVAWLDAELAANGGQLPGFVAGTTDWGLMGDFALARIATGHAAELATRAQAQVLLDHLGTYSTWDDQGAGFEGVRISGALAKVYLVALGAGLDTTDVDGVDLEAEMRSLMLTDGPQAGRFADRNPHGPDYSLALGQSWAMMALSHTTDGVPAQAIAFLVDQQCPAGGFRLVYDGTPGCDDDVEADPDSTALAVQVLLALDRDAALSESVTAALEWLAGRQEPDGSFGGGMYTEAPNANSTGLISQTLRAAGRTEAADAATAWILEQLQLGAGALGTAAEGDRGAIAYDPATRTAALGTGIVDSARDQWRRSTAQGVLGLGAGLLVEVEDPDGNSGETTSTTTPGTSSTTTVVAPTNSPQGPSGPGAAQVAGNQSSPTGSTGASGSSGARLAVTG